jgi:hypothetical protein
MRKPRIRQPITAADVESIIGVSPLAEVSHILGVRIFDVGQGDAIAVLGKVDGKQKQVLLLDYGGRERSPFDGADDIDRRMPVEADQLLMLSHWDEDHWCAAKRGRVAKAARWLVPRQITSPRAVLFSGTLKHIRCIPEQCVRQPIRFDGRSGDYVVCEKIGAYAGPFAKDEDCNRTGVALAVVHMGLNGGEAILLPGDAPFDKADIFNQLARNGVRLRAIVAFHHGAGTHWTTATEQLLKNWPKSPSFEVIFSCSDPNSYDHPCEAMYKDLLPGATFRKTAKARLSKKEFIDILF